VDPELKMSSVLISQKKLECSNVKILQAESLLNWQMPAADPEMKRTQWLGEASIGQAPN